MSEFAETIAPKLVLQPWQADGNPAKIRTLISCQSWTSCTELCAHDQSATAMMAPGPSSLASKYKHFTDAACVTPPP